MGTYKAELDALKGDYRRALEALSEFRDLAHQEQERAKVLEEALEEIVKTASAALNPKTGDSESGCRLRRLGSGVLGRNLPCRFSRDSIRPKSASG